MMEGKHKYVCTDQQVLLEVFLLLSRVMIGYLGCMGWRRGSCQGPLVLRVCIVHPRATAAHTAPPIARTLALGQATPANCSLTLWLSRWHKDPNGAQEHDLLAAQSSLKSLESVSSAPVPKSVG